MAARVALWEGMWRKEENLLSQFLPRLVHTVASDIVEYDTSWFLGLFLFILGA